MIALEKDIPILREGGRRLASYLDQLESMATVGMTAKELEDKALSLIYGGNDKPAFLDYKAGKNGEPYPSALCVSVNDVIVHSPGACNGAVFADGDIVSLDFGINHGGLFTDSARTVIVGKPKCQKDKELVSAAYEALQAGIDQARVGNTTGDIGHAVERIARKYGLGFPRILAGHGVGAAVHEQPCVPNFGRKGTGYKLVENLVIAIEPMFALGSGELYIDKDGFSYRTEDGSRTSHAEHTIIITKDGPEIITKSLMI